MWLKCSGLVNSHQAISSFVRNISSNIWYNISIFCLHYSYYCTVRPWTTGAGTTCSCWCWCQQQWVRTACSRRQRCQQCGGEWWAGTACSCHQSCRCGRPIAGGGGGHVSRHSPLMRCLCVGLYLVKVRWHTSITKEINLPRGTFVLYNVKRTQPDSYTLNWV